MAQPESLLLVKSTVKKGDKITEHIRYFISSCLASAQTMLSYTRGHWGIENKLHWRLDVIFCEDASTTRDIYAVQNLAALRGIALSLLLQNEMLISIKNKRARAAANSLYLMEVLLNQCF